MFAQDDAVFWLSMALLFGVAVFVGVQVVLAAVAPPAESFDDAPSDFAEDDGHHEVLR